MSYLENGRVWVDYLNKASRTISSFTIINQTCEDSIKLMWKMNSGIFDAVKKQWGRRKLPNHQIFVSIYYKRNIIYLQSSHALACMGFIDPSLNLNRTVFETILKGYLFIVDHKEADEYYCAIKRAIENKEDETYTIGRGVSYLRKKLYMPAMSEKHKLLYKLLCISAHSDIKGTARDFPNYLPNRIRDNLNMILLLMYGNIQMMAESFFDFLDSNTKAYIKEAMENIAFDVGSVPLFEPNREPYALKLKFKKGNFLDVL
ncbi:hypothetical protein MUO79_09545 [Candidatus Bathyarchaeota archaeon]|nr:hypothetical protein [Candidatus Bathyarchaeota archaeon]